MRPTTLGARSMAAWAATQLCGEVHQHIQMMPNPFTSSMSLFGLCLMAAATIVPGYAFAQANQSDLDLEFAAWIESEIWPEAEAADVSRSVFDLAFAGVVLDLTLPELVLPGAGNEPAIDQAEYRSPALYFDESGLATLARIGREEWESWSSTLTAIERRYGIPAEILLAIWGRESAYGRARIPHYAIGALATGAFLGRRADRFRTELIAALLILEAGHVTPGAMKSSWAGGLGLPQFVPTSFLAYAIDFDGDGRRDIWGSVPDALASIANYLVQHGWDSSLDWGEEVAHPAGVSCTLEGPDQGRPAAAWEQIGLVPRGAVGGEVRYLMMPAGRLGPSFLVTDNFYVLREYNRSDLYALYVGHLADRIGNRNAAIDGQWQPIGDLTHGEIQQVQVWLLQAGYDVRTLGIIGYKTRVAVGSVQSTEGLAETCIPDRPFLRSMR